MANVMSFKNVKNKPHRSAFDLSYKNAMSAKVGELLPCFVKEVLPGDEFHIKPSNFTRTTPVNTAAFTRIRENVDFFFVPYRLLWDKWTQFIAQTDDPHYAMNITTAAGSFSSTPFMTASDINSVLRFLKTHDGNGSDFACLDASQRVAYAQTIKLLQYLGYGSFTFSLSTPAGFLSGSTAISPFRLAAYQKIYYDFYRNSQWELSKPQCYNFDYMFQSSQLRIDSASLVNGITSSMPFDSLFTLRYANYSKDLTMGLNPSPQFGDTAIAGPILGNAAITNASASGFGLKLLVGGPYSTEPNQARWLGYNPNDNSFTARAWDDTGAHTAVSTTSGIYFPPAGYNNISNLSIPASAQSGISVLALRLAESLQKYKEITLTGSKDYKDQIEKHWGVRVPDYASDLCQRVYSYDSMIEISEVINQNLGADEANIKGRGVSAGSGSFTWKNNSNDFGILMGIYHAEPLLDYQSDLFVDRTVMNTLPSSFPIPELDSIGMEAVPKYCIAIPNKSSGDIIDTSVQGYAPRYFEYKTARDIVQGAFGAYGSVLSSGNMSYNGGFASWVSAFSKNFAQRLNSTVIDYQSFKIDPSLLNSIFVAQVSSKTAYFPDTSYPAWDDEQLLCKFFFDCKVNRNLSYDGLPY